MAKSLIVVPTYNELDNVRGIADRLLAALPRTDLLFVDDNSPDGTGALLDQMATAQPRIHVMHRAGKLGLGTAYVEGFQWGLARDYDYLFEMDADGSHDPQYLPTMLALAEDGADLVVGSRYVPGGGTENWGIGRKIISRGDPRGRRARSDRGLHLLASRGARGDRSPDDHVERLQLPDRDEVPGAAPRPASRGDTDRVRGSTRGTVENVARDLPRGLIEGVVVALPRFLTNPTSVMVTSA
jgi:glycosyltransferase involved in cell wall biosynthesis